MKYLRLLVIVLVAVLCFAACTPKVVDKPVDDTDTVDTVDPVAASQTFEGIITQASMSSIEVTSPTDFTSYNIGYDSSVVDTAAASVELGNYAVVTYTGTLGDDVTAYAVESIVVSDAPAQVIEGTISNASMNDIEVTTASNGVYNFSTVDVPVQGDPLENGAHVMVYYSGIIGNTDGAFKLYRVVVGEGTVAEAHVSGIVGDGSSMNNLVVLTSEGHTYTFGIDGVDVSGAGIENGASVIVYYSGELSEDGSGTTVTHVVVK